MTAPLEFGSAPLVGTCRLNRYATFRSIIESEDGNWPDGTGFSFKFRAPGATEWTEWPADVDGALATWTVDPDDVAAVLDSGATEYRVFYTDDTGTDVWSEGPIDDVSE
jgi:hypothetical protein